MRSIQIHRPKNQRRVIKVITKSRTDIDYDGIRREVGIMKGLSHSKIVSYFDSFEDANNFNIIAEYMDGGNLRQLMT